MNTEWTAQVPTLFDAYKAFVQSPGYDGIYKWQIAKTVQDNWHLEAQDLAAMIDRSFSHRHQNLWSGQNFLPKLMLREWAQRNAADCRTVLGQLIHGEAPLADRMRQFAAHAKRSLTAARPDKELTTYQDVRAMSLWVGMVQPEKYYLYKASTVNGFIQRTGHAPLPKPGDTYTVIDGYYQLCEEVRAQLLAHPDVIEAHRALRDASCHADTAHHLLVHDFIYFVGEHMGTMASGSDTGYWIFQGNPAFYDTAGALRAGVVKEWGVGAHKDRIRPGDKVILWVTGPQGGCHALAIVTSKVGLWEAEDDGFSTNSGRVPLEDRVSIRIDENLVEHPVTWAMLKDLPDMSGFKAGRQGTTFQATRAEYETIRQLSKSTTGTNMHPLNTILYGPPGTGKTYHAITHAVAIIDGEDVEVVKQRPREQVRQRYQELVEARLVRTVTFHQSFSYEDFVEGIKPQTHVSKDGDEEVKLVTYEVQDGIFKLMCASARSGEHGSAAPGLDEATLGKANFYKVSLGQYNSPADDAIYAYCMEHNVMAVGYGGTVDVGRAKDEATIRRILEDAGMKDSESLRYSITVLRTMHLDMKEGDIVLVSAGNSLVRAIGRVSGGYVMDESAPIRFKQFRKVQWLVKDVEIPVEDLYPKSFVMGTLYSLDPNLVKKDYFRKAVASPVKRDGRYVLIIDEINRGNVASIFGELITLIEDDKREGGREAARVKLPYSKKDDFSVPSNLYLLGTMNTADRSVEALDTALRRRFSFVEMPSLPEVIEPASVAGVDLYALLTRINQRVERLLDKDHHIGHSYFMGLKDLEGLKRTFRNKVIPLLEEYFHGDARKVGAVLGKDFVEEVKNNVPFAKEFELDDYEVKTIYRLTDVNAITDAQPFVRIYANA